MSRAVKIVFAMSIGLIGLSACDKDKSYPITPSLEFKSFEIADGKSRIVCYFRDGDGDIGSDDSDGGEPCPQLDVLYTYYELEDGVWLLSEDYQGGWCLKSLTPTGQDKTLEGDVQMELDYPLAIPPTANSDSTRIGMRLQDRSGHISNEVFSPTMVQ